jgi:NTE family protein
MAKIHLVLGAGGARGMAHIGIIEELEKDGHEIVEIVGCSMGAVVGGVYCAGHLNEYKEWLLALTKSAVFKLMDFTLTTRGFLKGERIFSHILDMFGTHQIENFDIPFTAVAFDLHQHNEVYFTKGDLYQALRASISIPGIFTPVYLKEQILVDGGVANPLPLNLIKKPAADDHFTIAVNINAHAKTSLPVKQDMIEEKDEKTSNSWPFNLSIFKKNHESTPSLSLIELLQTSYDTTQDRVTKLMIDQYKPDLLIEIPRSTCGIFEFYKAKDLIELGRSEYKKSIVNHPQLNQA